MVAQAIGRWNVVPENSVRLKKNANGTVSIGLAVVENGNERFKELAVLGQA